MTRTLVTFVLRLWVDQAQEPAWEGRMECVSNGAWAHVRSLEDVMRFIAAQMSGGRKPTGVQKEENTQTQPGDEFDQLRV